MRVPLFETVFEDDDLLVVNKCAGLVCHPTKGDIFSSLVSRVRFYLGSRESVELDLHMINRLDRETSGVVVFAKRLEAAREIRKLWMEGSVDKEYVTLVHGRVGEERGMIRARLGEDEKSEVSIRNRVREDGVEALTEYWVEQRFEYGGEEYSRLGVRLWTGRKHQIRIHMEHLGHPIVGDKLYGRGGEGIYLEYVSGKMGEEGRRTMVLPWQALHARRVSLEWRGEKRVFEAGEERWFREFHEKGQNGQNGQNW